ncbi:hypothetical protein ACX27_04240 [Nostoc piscinale CENA21]|uniref:Uncharacterized protein n=1 Tax=Nostoc piscinale CENA21 TaxID=224013 RepID=A0A0M4SP58_9NOSO|nr:hypothetical protein [Nostoc piscinale]ALF52240.1 hypothetical protein ACX27_04240 [Nostoc piscinale CENA21]
MEPKPEPVTTTLEEYLRAHEGKAIDFALRVDFNSHAEGQVSFYIHPVNADGDTLDYKVKGNTVECFTQKAV